MIINHLSRELGARRMSQRALVRRTGLSASTIADVYHARSGRVDLVTLDKLCAALDVPVSAVLEYRADPREP